MQSKLNRISSSASRPATRPLARIANSLGCIGKALSISEETVKTHVANLLAKLHVENRAQATVQALKRGLLSMDDLET